MTMSPRNVMLSFFMLAIFLGVCHVQKSFASSTTDATVSTTTQPPVHDTAAVVGTQNHDAQRTGNKQDNKSDPIINGYTIGLGILGIFSFLNALAIYNKKEQYDREIGEIIKQHQAVVSLSENNHKEAQSKFQEMKLEIDKLSLGIDAKVNEIYKDMDKNTDELINKLNDNFQNLLDDLNKQHMNKLMSLEGDFAKWSNEITRHISDQQKIFNRHYYSYTLYSLIPLFLTDPRNRKAVQSALYWYSQHADGDDLNMLKERLDKIPPGDQELITVCSLTINVVQDRLGLIS